MEKSDLYVCKPENKDMYPDLTTQDYSKKNIIFGVQILPIKRFKDDGGSFMEVSRFNSEGDVLFNGNKIDVNNFSEHFKIQQLNHSYIQPGVIKAWHIHLWQEDLWFVPPHDRLLVGLYDLRQDSASRGDCMRFVLGDGEGQVLLIPRGVAHGCANLSDKEMQLIYIVNQTFDPDNPDEHRLPWDALVGKEFWQLQKG